MYDLQLLLDQRARLFVDNETPIDVVEKGEFIVEVVVSVGIIYPGRVRTLNARDGSYIMRVSGRQTRKMMRTIKYDRTGARSKKKPFQPNGEIFRKTTRYLTLAPHRGHVAITGVDLGQNAVFRVADDDAERRFPAILAEVIQLFLRRAGHNDEYFRRATVVAAPFIVVMWVNDPRNIRRAISRNKTKAH